MADIVLGKAYGKTVKLTVNPTNNNAATISLQLDVGNSSTKNLTSSGGGGSSSWGGITGTLSDQTDLSAALGGKASTASLAAKAPIDNPTFTGTASGTFSGPLTGNVTGNCTGSSGSCTGNAATSSSCSGNAATATSATSATTATTATTANNIASTALAQLGAWVTLGF